MGVPVTTVRVDPVGRRLEDGYRSLITFAADPNVSLWERTVKPPGIDGGDSIDTSTMHNDVWRTKASRALKELTDAGMECGYDPVVYDQIVALCNVETSITILFSNNDTLAFFGYLKSADTNDLAEGEFPTLTCVVVCTNTDPADGSEAGPNYITAAGTDA